MANESNAASIFFSALELPTAEERAAFLDDACGQDDALRQRVDKLLAAEPHVGTFLEEPVTNHQDALDQAGSRVGPGTIIGPYKLLQEIGEGGFGIVYMAEQLKPVRRHVALKIVKPGMDTREVIARFEAERQALAMMDHSNIARVFDAGATESGRPYFVMELVKGVPITEFCDKNNFNTERRLKLFMTVCRAVQHAHQKGVIHRDLKPSNILITLHDGDPVPKVIDFGVAKAISQRLTELTMFTRYGQMIGTPQYMSPEQAEMSGLDVDTRSDIYSLGVLLYELLTGATPLDAERIRTAAYNEMLQMIQAEEPLKPSTRISTLGDGLTVVCAHRQTNESALRKSIRGDLDWIVMKALEKHRDRRYETANEFARDVQRHLDQEPVIAGPPSAIYLLSKLARRNKVAFTTAAAVLAALMFGLALAIWGFMSANYHRGLAESGLSRAEAAEQGAIAQRDEAQKAKDSAETARREAARRSEELANRVYGMQLATIDRSLSDNNFLRARRQLSDCSKHGWGWQFLNDRYAAAIRVQLPSCEQPLFTSDGARLVAIGGSYNSDESKQVVVWDLASKTPLKKLSCETTLQCVAMSADEKWVVAGANGGHVILWDLEKAIQEWTVFALQADSKVRFGGICFSPDGTLIAATSWDGYLRVFNRSDGSLKFDVALGGNPRKVSFSPDGRWLVSRDVIADASSGEIVEKFTAGHVDPTFSPDGRLIATGSAAERKIHLWDWDGEKLSHKTSWKASNSNRFGDLRFCNDGAYLASAQGAYLAVWDLNSRKKVASLNSPLGMAWWLGVHPKNDAIGFGTSDGLGIWHYTGHDERITVPPREQPIRLLKFSSDGEKIAMGSHRGQHGVSAADGDIAGEIAIIKSATGEHLRTIDGNYKGFCWIPESPNLIVLTRDGDQTHAMYDVDAGAIVREFEGNSAIGRPHVDTLGRVLTSIGKGFTVRAWSIDSGQVIDEFSLGTIWGGGNVRAPIGGLWNATVGPHGHRVAVGQGGDIRIWDTRTKQEVEPRLPNHERTTDTLAFTDDGDHLLAIVGNDRFALFDITTKEVLRGFSGPFGAMAMSPDEKNIASCGDRLVIWDVESGLPFITLADAVDGDFVAVDWSPDNQRIAAARSDGTVHIWKLPTGP